MNNWIYKAKEIKSLDDMPDGVFGFVYELTHTPSGRKYLGKKQLIYIRNKKIGKRETARLKEERKEAGIEGWWNVPNRKEVRKESDWLEYYGSNDEIQELIQRDGKDSFERRIIKYAYHKKQLTYLETEYQFKRNVLGDEQYFNTNILGKFFPKDIKDNIE